MEDLEDRIKGLEVLVCSHQIVIAAMAGKDNLEKARRQMQKTYPWIWEPEFFGKLPAEAREVLGYVPVDGIENKSKAP